MKRESPVESSNQTKELTDSDHQELPWSDHIDYTIRIVKDCQHHIFLRSWWWPILWMRAWMHNIIHVQIEIVEFFSIWIRLREIHRNCLSMYVLRALFDDRGDDLGILLGKPSEQCGDTLMM